MSKTELAKYRCELSEADKADLFGKVEQQLNGTSMKLAGQRGERRAEHTSSCA